jgi:hypothetical protein
MVDRGYAALLRLPFRLVPVAALAAIVCFVNRPGVSDAFPVLPETLAFGCASACPSRSFGFSLGFAGAFVFKGLEKTSLALSA